MMLKGLDMLRRRNMYDYFILALLVISIYLFGFCAINNIPAGMFMRSSRELEPMEISHETSQKDSLYSGKYPLTDLQVIPNGKRYSIAVIADLDEERSKTAKKPWEWHSYLKTGYLLVYESGNFVVEFTNTITLKTRLSEKGRGLELSELCTFNGKLYTVDDRTGVVYELLNEKAIPWVILMDGNGVTSKGFKSEWMTVKDGVMFVGSIGKEFTTREGKLLNNNPMFVKSIDHHGGVVHHNWTEHYTAIRAKLGIYFPGYMIHEAVMWSSIKKRWYFLPRRMSKQRYNDVVDEKRGTNVLISAEADFSDMNVVQVGPLDLTHGFSSFKFIPDTGDNWAIALKTKEVEEEISSFVMVFNVDTGKVLFAEQFIENNKYEGIEFI